MGFIMNYLFSSVGKKQIVALTGLGLILFLIAHLSGNLLIFLGPEAFNKYAAKMQSLGGLLWVMRFGLLATFLVHIGFTAMVVIENKRARGGSYAKFNASGKRSWATRTMSISGVVLLVFVIFHLRDFTLSDHHGPASYFNGENLGLYGLVVNSFMSPIRATLYIIAMFAVGSHVSHAFESAFQSFGLNHLRITPVVIKLSKVLGILLILGYSSIPLYIFFKLQ